ncbi:MULTISPECIES: hypothetical protein [Paraburkholderia]|uniref:Uncharacterized protein n=1 Tax=Paraburkholderia madseniana TaxID=2599607 RepID=A0AAP5BD23_9BURK|nr:MULTISPECIES: hypothetical protein [Paraburkholderia]MCX4146384.1 hypothetical protein [Paraburkholderia madseniana]MDN7149330.1 hypothetical protein [Paraburkholderia sp. WS6]MDQ6408210.1 hypothetical protein [Paraburkholderia madseniana]
MDRRAFMMTGAWLSTAAGGAWPWLADAAARRDTLAVIDSTLAGGPAFADYVARMKLPVFEAGDDIGALWYTTLAPRFRQTPTQTPASLIGLTRASDYFVLRELATRVGHLVEHSHEQGEGPVAHVAFALTPRLIR